MSDISEISKKLADISEVMSDGFHFVKLRFFLESLEERKDSDILANDVLKMVEQFHRLCLLAKNNLSHGTFDTPATLVENDF